MRQNEHVQQSKSNIKLKSLLATQDQLLWSLRLLISSKVSNLLKMPCRDVKLELRQRLGHISYNELKERPLAWQLCVRLWWLKV